MHLAAEIYLQGYVCGKVFHTKAVKLNTNAATITIPDTA